MEKFYNHKIDLLISTSIIEAGLDIPKANTLIVYKSNFLKEQYKIDWSNECVTIHNQIRAFDPYPGSYAIFNNKRIKLFGSHIEEIDVNNDIVPGKLLPSEDKLLIKVNSGLISVSSIQLEGKKKVQSKDFIKTLDNKEYILE